MSECGESGQNEFDGQNGCDYQKESVGTFLVLHGHCLHGSRASSLAGFRCLGFGVRGSRRAVWGLGCSVWDLELRL